jgi:hypothetical protein
MLGTRLLPCRRRLRLGRPEALGLAREQFRRVWWVGWQDRLLAIRGHPACRGHHAINECGHRFDVAVPPAVG